MEKLKFIKIEDENGNLSDNIPIGADAKNIDTESNSTVEAELNSLKTKDKGIDNSILDLQNKVKSLASGSPLVANNVNEMTDITRVYVNTTDGHWYYYNGSAWADGGIYQATEVSDIGVEQVNFLDPVYNNLFKGDYVLGLHITGAGINNFSLKLNSAYNSLAIVPCKSNTLYTVLMTDPGLEDGYYYLKVATVNVQTKAEIVPDVALTGIMSNTNKYKERTEIQTGNDATFLLIETSKSRQPFLQIVEGQISDFTVSSYDESVYGVPNNKLDVYNKEQINNLIAEALKNLTVENVNFLDKIRNNLFDGNYIEGYSISGNVLADFVLKQIKGFNSLAIVPCKPNTKYTILVTDGGAEDNGYYYFKVATTNVEKISDLKENINVPGLFQNTRKYQKRTVVTTLEDTTFLLVQSSRTKQPFLQIVEGEISDFTISSYDEEIQGIPNNRLLIYSKGEVDEKISKINTSAKYIVVKNSDTELYIYFRSSVGYVRYKYYLHTNNNINLKTWQMGAIWLCDFNRVEIKEVSSDSYDQEGVLKITNEVDYIGGIHGDEQFTNVWFFINGKPINIVNLENETECEEFKVIVESDIYHANDSTGTPCLHKTKQTTFDSTGIHVNNKWTCLESLLIYHVRAILLSVNKDCITEYYDSNVYTTPMEVPESDGGKNNNKMTDTFYSGILSAHIWCGERGGDESMYRGTIADFGTRLKSYFDCYTNYEASINDELHCQNNFIINY